jgi:hypothetical protein
MDYGRLPTASNGAQWTGSSRRRVNFPFYDGRLRLSAKVHVARGSAEAARRPRASGSMNRHVTAGLSITGDRSAMDITTATPASPFSHVDPDDVVLTFREWCEVNRFSQATGRRLIATGAGPVITRLSERRIGITVGANRRWLHARSSSAA